MELLRLVIGWSLAIFLAVLEAIFLYRVATNQISLKYLISDDRGFASLSRFQFLIFTFVIAMTLFYLIIAKGEYPVIPNQILALLGISGGSYVVAKGIVYCSNFADQRVYRLAAGKPPEPLTPASSRIRQRRSPNCRLESGFISSKRTCSTVSAIQSGGEPISRATSMSGSGSLTRYL